MSTADDARADPWLIVPPGLRGSVNVDALNGMRDQIITSALPPKCTRCIIRGRAQDIIGAQRNDRKSLGGNLAASLSTPAKTVQSTAPKVLKKPVIGRHRDGQQGNAGQPYEHAHDDHSTNKTGRYPSE
jgi:hypothetical protein